MNKSQIIDAVVEETGIRKIDVKRAVDSFVNVATRTLQEQEKVTISGFGTFLMSNKSARVGRNPRTGAAVKVPAKKIIRFKSSIDIGPK